MLRNKVRVRFAVSGHTCCAVAVVNLWRLLLLYSVFVDAGIRLADGRGGEEK